MKNKVILHRKKEMNNRAKSYKIFVNGAYYDDLHLTEKKIIITEANSLRLKLKIDWCTSQEYTIKFTDQKNSKEYEISSSIPNTLWYTIVVSMLFSLLLFLILKIKLFGIISIIFVLIPIYKITLDKNNYLILNEI